MAGVRSALPMLVPALATFLIGMWRIDRPSFWRDESVAVLVSRQSPADIVAYVRNTDAVHGAYYLLMHLVTGLGPSELIARLPSALAAALAAGGIAIIGRRLVSTRAGLLAGLIFALLPVVSRYAQEARSYSIVSAVAVLATYLLLRALVTTTARATWFAGYALSVAALGWLHLDAILLVGAHAMVVLVHCRMAGSARSLAWWSGAVVAATAAVLPLVAEARSQSAQVSWLRPPDSGVVGELATFVAGTTAIAVAVALVGLVGIRLRPAPGGLPGVGVVALSWLVIPFAALVAVSALADPMYHPRYLLHCVAGGRCSPGLDLTGWPAWPGGSAHLDRLGWFRSPHWVLLPCWSGRPSWPSGSRAAGPTTYGRWPTYSASRAGTATPCSISRRIGGSS